jgi:exonuclease SbcC
VRLHQLEITAFGPFAETVAVDFDHLSDAGLFLLSGPTGAGKTSVLDAVCFALYGDVPGARNTAKRLRSDQAAPGARPRVTLEATLSGRRFRLVRSPSWERPKKRGTGVTTEQASVSVAERVDGDWVTHSTRLDETGHLVTRLVGMNLAQFIQVAMLPQGEFQTFLRARSEERHRLLQQLFRTGRFEDVERWLRDRRIALRRSSETAHQRVAGLVSRVSEAVEAPAPEAWDLHDLAAPATDGAILGWATALRAEADAGRADADTAAVRAAAAEAAARQALDDARAVAERRARVDAALAEQATLADHADAVEAARVALDAARRSATVLPLHRLALRATAARDRAAAVAQDASERAATALDLPGLEGLWVDRGSLDAAVAEAVEAAARVKAALPREAALTEVATALEATDERAGLLAEQMSVAEAAAAALPQRTVTLRDELATARAAAAAVDGQAARVSDLTARVEAAAQVVAFEEELALARLDLQMATTETLTRWSAYLDIRQARLEGMAAEMAGALAVGDSCPVCGSAEHPHKAYADPGAPDALAEKAAEKRHVDATSVQVAHEERVRNLVTNLALTRQAAGPEPAGLLTAQRAEAAAELARLRELASRVEPRSRELADLEGEATRLGEELTRLRLEAGALGADQRHGRERLAALRDEIDDLLRGTGAPDLASLHAQHSARAATGRTACEALDALAGAESSLVEATTSLADAVERAGFASAEAAVAAALPDPEVRDLDARLEAHGRRLAAVAAVLAEPGSAELAEQPLPDLIALGAAHDQALAALGEARSTAARWQRRFDRLGTLHTELTAALGAWTPIRDDLELTTRLSSFVDGKSPDNRLQMRLSAYVLAYRLSQVVAAANARLAGMSDQRYSLEHTGRRGAGETRGGLSILVRDDWSGESRDPATLSGGETFVVSLALALGLADVVTHEAGGADLDTLFVDEGFGSLDADTLDDVMDTLDSLRDGGRVVGVVSHVAEMRDRIPVQLLVTKSRRGSTLSVSR